MAVAGGHVLSIFRLVGCEVGGSSCCCCCCFKRMTFLVLFLFLEALVHLYTGACLGGPFSLLLTLGAIFIILFYYSLPAWQCICPSLFVCA